MQNWTEIYNAGWQKGETVHRNLKEASQQNCFTMVGFAAQGDISRDHRPWNDMRQQTKQSRSWQTGTEALLRASANNWPSLGEVKSPTSVHVTLSFTAHCTQSLTSGHCIQGQSNHPSPSDGCPPSVILRGTQHRAVHRVIPSKCPSRVVVKRSS